MIAQGQCPSLDEVNIEILRDFYPFMTKEVKSIREVRKSLMELDFSLMVENKVVQFACDEQNIVSNKQEMKKILKKIRHFRKVLFVADYTRERRST
jgi:endo-alpha-1,4-polygalactosaminidase (GH114 family)